MPVESATTIAQLDDTWPLSGGPIPEGDDHLRLIKGALKAQFPGQSGDGFNVPIVAKEAELNHLAGVTGNIQDQITAEATSRVNEDNALGVRVAALESLNYVNLLFPVGSVYFSAANTNPSALLGGGTWEARGQGRFIVGVGTGNDGEEGRAYGAGNSGTGTYRHQLTTAEMPAHTHAARLGSDDNSGGKVEHGGGVYNGTDSSSIQPTGGNGKHENSPPAFGLYVWQRTG